MSTLSHDTLVRLAHYLEHHMGLFFPQKKWDGLERQIIKSLADFNFNDAESFVDWLLSSVPPTKKQIEILASYLTIGETYFFREKQVFETLEERIIPELIDAHRKNEQRLRIWSAGCCTGEEAYSIAILLYKMLPDLKAWNISILATDINTRFLHKASEGVYGKWSFRDCPQWVKEGFFRKTKENHFEILPDIKKMVTFSYLNLVEDSYPSLLNHTNAMDAIFCRNVIMYFTEETAKKVVYNLSHSLVEGGWLVVSPSESSYIPSPPFSVRRFPNAILYKKESVYRKAKEIHYMFPHLPHEETKSPSPARTCADSAPKRVIAQVCETPPPCEKAQALYEQGRYGEATEELLALVSHNQDTVMAIALLARAYANQGKLMEALRWCERGIASDKLVSGLHYLRATILQEQGAVEEAVMSLKRTLYLDPDFVLAHFAMGVLDSQRGKFTEADKHFKNVLELLRHCQQEETLPESDGITAGRLSEIVRLIKKERGLACLK